MAPNRLSLTPVLIGFLSIGAFVGVMYFSLQGFSTNKNLNTTNNANFVACTREAKLCPDGSSVGREGPNCEFAACPAYTVADTTYWKTYTDKEEKYTLRYPPEYRVIQSEHSVSFATTGTAGSRLSVSIYDGRTGCCGAYSEAMDAWTRGGFREFTWDPGENKDVYAGEFPPGYYDKRTVRLGENTFTVFLVGSGMDSVNHYFLKKGSAIYSFESSYHGNEQSSVDIISTFKFTDSTTDWKTYTNSSLGYSIQYPPTWTQTVEEDTVLIVPPATVAVNYAEGSTRLIIQKVDKISSDLVTDSQSVTVNGQTATQQSEGGLGVYTATYFPKGQGYIEIIYDKDVTQAEFPEILATFIFTQ